jgi:hypothetical protein
MLIGVGVFLAGIFLVAAYRARAALHAVEQGPYLRVHAIGWCRPPDGCNYAIFDGTDRDTPTWVLRLPLRRPMTVADAWLCGDARPSQKGAVALIDDSGDLLGAGRIVSVAKGMERWRRSMTAPGRLVQKPPEGWYPPGSH